jgi:dihydroflavonol-4-reductase
MFELLSQATGIPAPVEAPEALVRLVGAGLDAIGRRLAWQPPIDRERVHYLYDRCVRVDASKARRELGWAPRSVETTLRELVTTDLGDS